MKKLLGLLITCVLHTTFANSQGCIAVRNISGFGQYIQGENAFSSSKWIVSFNNRYYKSANSFVGTKDNNMSENDEVVLHGYSLNIMATRLMANGWSISFDLPVSYNDRTSTEEHGGLGTTRHTTHSFGLGDIRFEVFKWLLKPSARQKANVQIALGVKIPSGDYKYQDIFYRNDSTKILAPVEIPIQLGDGGTGIITELNAFYHFNRTIGLFGNLYYLINPREQNGILNTFGRIPTVNQVKSGYYIASVPDQYSTRGGVNFNSNKLSFSVALRYEGVPVYDLIGGSNYARKAGYNTSVEPGLLYKSKQMTLFSYVPVIISRKIKQNVPDKILSNLIGEYTVKHGGSPDYLVFVGASFKF